MKKRALRRRAKKAVAFMSALSLAVTGSVFVGCEGGYVKAAETLESHKNVKKSAEEITDTDDVYAKSSKARVSVHDPAIIKDTDGTYYIFGSHLAWAKSKDLENWTTFTNNISTDYRTLFAKEFEWASAGDSVYDPSGNVWAPDVIWNESMQKWCMYMSINGCSWNSCICLLTADRLDGNWTYVGPVVYSGFTEKDVQNGIRSFEKTDYAEVTGRSTLDTQFIRTAYSEKDNGTVCTATTWNKSYGAHAIDACVFYDEEGKLWFSYGSWSGGIYIFELNEATGFRKNTEEAKNSYTDAYMGKKLGGSGASGEASYIEYIDGYYYLFLSYGGLVANGGYQMRVFRSKNPDGPYSDVSGDLATKGGDANGTIGTRLMSYYKWSWWDYAHVAQGHNSAFVDDDGKAYLIYHTRTNDGTEGHTVRVHQLFTSENGYLVAAPFEYTSTDNVAANGYSAAEVAGTYEILFQRNTNSASLEYNKPQVLTLSADGKITGDASGTWTAKANSPLVSIQIGSITYEGTFVKQDIEGTNVQTLCFTTVGTDDICLWGAKYPSDDVAVAMTADRITLPKIITDDIELTTEGLFGATIEWEGNSSLLSDGTVIPPAVDRACTITATVKKGNYTCHKKFDTTILSKDDDKPRKVASYFDTQPLQLSSSTVTSVDNPLYGMNIKNGVTIKFTAARTAEADMLATIFGFNTTQGTADGTNGRLYMTDCTYLGYNATGGFFDGNLNVANQPYQVATDYLDGLNKTKKFEIKLMPNGYSVYVDGALAYSNETVKAGGTALGNTDMTDYSNVLTWLSKTATYINFGVGSWWAGTFSGTISDFEIWAEPVKESSLGSNYYYYQDYEEAASEADLSWDNAAVTKALGTDHTKYAKLTPSGSGNRGSISPFELSTAPTGEFFITEDILFHSSTDTSGSTVRNHQIAIAANDITYSSGSQNEGIASGYILKLNANGTGNQEFTINDTADTVTLPSDKWVNIRLDMDSSDLTKATLTITNLDTNTAIISNKEITVNGLGDISGAKAGSYVQLGRGNATACIDNIKIGKPGVADYEGLDKAITLGEKYAKLSGTYTSASMNALNSAVSTAKALDRSLPAEQQETLDNAEKAITDAIAALECANHEYTVTEYIKKPTCTETGRAKQICCLCGKTETEREADVEALGHTPGEWEITKAPTTSAEGVKVKKCTVCSEVVKTASIDKLPEAPDTPEESSTLANGLIAEYLFAGDLTDSKNPSKAAKIVAAEDEAQDNLSKIVADKDRGNVVEMRGTWQATGYLELDKDYVNGIDDAFTVTMWAKANNSKTDNGQCGADTSIFNFKTTPDSWSEKDENGADTYTYGFVSLDVSLHPWINDGKGNWVDRKAGDAGLNLSADKWQQITMSIDGANNKIYVYIDGSLAETVSGLGGDGTCASLLESIKTNTTAIQIGTFLPWWNTWDFRGYVDDVRMYDRLLTGDEVSALYQRSADKSVIQASTPEASEKPDTSSAPGSSDTPSTPGTSSTPSTPGSGSSGSGSSSSGSGSSSSGSGSSNTPATITPTSAPTGSPAVQTPAPSSAPTASSSAGPAIPTDPGTVVPTQMPVPTETPAGDKPSASTPPTSPGKTPKPSSKPAAVKPGNKVVVEDLEYTITSTTGTKTAEYTKTKTDSKTLIVPASVKISGKKYDVTSIKKNALKNNKKIEKLVVGKNIKKIGKNAFKNCSKLKVIVIKSKKLTLKKTGSNAFKGINGKAEIRVPKGMVKKYKKLVKAKGAGKNITVKAIKTKKKSKK